VSKQQTKLEPKLKNKTYVVCTDNNQRVKGLIVQKNEDELVIDLPSGYQMHMTRKPKRKLYIHHVGMLEFTSDGWEIN
jgi:hypothetical protein